LPVLPEGAHVNVAYVSLGANIDPAANLAAAVRRLAETCQIIGVSPVYETAAVGDPSQPNFLNAAVMVQTALPAVQLKETVLDPIERALGRLRTENPNDARTIDLDLVLFNQDVLEIGKRQVPDPDIVRYAHIARPLADIAPGYVHPVTGQTLTEVATTLAGTAGIWRRADIDLHAAARANE
jgi:2-amino-4-hydroxy-6-hydroxymethyldihydropteridine diphosphokinase